MRAVLAIALLAWPGSNASAQELSRAEQLYREAHYAEALTAFRVALSEPNVVLAAVLYNMGNCAYRLGHYAEASWHYRRARLRWPRDARLRHNLRLAEQRLGVVASAAAPLAETLRQLSTALRPAELLGLAVLLQSLGLALWMWAGRGRGRRIALLMLLLGVGLGGLCVVCRWYPGRPEAVVLDATVRLRSEPRGDLAAVLSLRPGIVVAVVESGEDWLRVIHPQGRGWTERAGLGIVD